MNRIQYEKPPAAESSSTDQRRRLGYLVIDLPIFKRRLLWNVPDLGERDWLDG